MSVRGPVHGSAAVKVMDDVVQGQGTQPEEEGGSSISQGGTGATWEVLDLKSQ